MDSSADDYVNYCGQGAIMSQRPLGSRESSLLSTLPLRHINNYEGILLFPSLNSPLLAETA